MEIVFGCEDHLIDAKFNFLVDRLAKLTNCSEGSLSEIVQRIAHFKSKFKSKLAAASRRRDIFLENEQEWLSGTVIHFISLLAETPTK